MLKKIAPYNKFLIALAGALATVAVQFYGKNPAVQLTVSFLTALGVVGVPNVPKGVL